jgi:hypothetical protein
MKEEVHLKNMPDVRLREHRWHFFPFLYQMNKKESSGNPEILTASCEVSSQWLCQRLAE